MNCIGDKENYYRRHHDADTLECPSSKEQAESNSKENYRRSHHGFNEGDFEYEQFKLPEISIAKHQGIRENSHLVRVTHKATGLWGEAVGNTYWEPLQKALKTLRWRVDLETRKES